MVERATTNLSAMELEQPVKEIEEASGASDLVSELAESPCGNRGWIILHDNVLNVPLTPATAIFIYLVPEGILALKDRLLAVSLVATACLYYILLNKVTADISGGSLSAPPCL